MIDIPTLLLPWLGFVWGAGSTANPLLDGFGVPSAVLVETAFGMAEVEITPGLATASSCPEAIYQAAKWWTGYYTETAGPQTTATRRRRRKVDEPPPIRLAATCFASVRRPTRSQSRSSDPGAGRHRHRFRFRWGESSRVDGGWLPRGPWRTVAAGSC